MRLVVCGEKEGQVSNARGVICFRERDAGGRVTRSAAALRVSVRLVVLCLRRWIFRSS